MRTATEHGGKFIESPDSTPGTDVRGLFVINHDFLVNP